MRVDPRIVTVRKSSDIVVPAVLTVIVLVVVVAVGLTITAHPAWSLAEDQAIRAVQSVGNAGMQIVAGAIAVGFGPAGGTLVALIVLSLGYLTTRSWRLTTRAAAVLVIPWAVAEALKDVVRRPRPDPALLGLTPDPISYSFPSGHTAFAAAAGCAVILVLAARRARVAAVVVAAAVVVLTGWSRVYVGAHYPTDVVASMLLVPVLAVTVDRLTVRVPFLR